VISKPLDHHARVLASLQRAFHIALQTGEGDINVMEGGRTRSQVIIARMKMIVL
jgi:hypothetical protein